LLLNAVSKTVGLGFYDFPLSGKIIKKNASVLSASGVAGGESLRFFA
jgi:hypothetical protein